jgi:outer membrane biosynthesis protein TonB
MNSARKIAALLLLLSVAGCKHKVQTAAQPAPPDKVYTPEEIANQAPSPQPPPPKPEDVKQAPTEVAEQPPPKPKKTQHRKKSTDTPTTQTAKDTTPSAAGTQEASAGQPPNTSPIGQLSSSSDSGSSNTSSHQTILDLIKSTESGLNGIKRQLSSDEQQTATQIRTFLSKAKKALDQDDLDGANTLATKAKVLLDELMKS